MKGRGQAPPISPHPNPLAGSRHSARFSPWKRGKKVRRAPAPQPTKKRPGPFGPGLLLFQVISSEPSGDVAVAIPRPRGRDEAVLTRFLDRIAPEQF